jgi:integrase
VNSDMPRPRPPHLHREVTRHGRVVWFVRVGKGSRTRIRATFGTPEFDSEYQVALSGAPRRSGKGPTVGTLAWLVERYRETAAWRDYSLATRRQRENIFKHVIATAGSEPVARITRAVIVAGRDRRGATPAAARHFLDAMRSLFAWAVDAQHAKFDPTAGIKDPARRKGSGFPIWQEEWVQKYYARWPIGTRQRVWIDMILSSGLRRGDAVRAGKQHVRVLTKGKERVRVIVIAIQKSGYTVQVTRPILPVLQKTLDAGPCGDLTFIVGARGNPLTKESFGNEFADACKLAGVPGRAHGLRKLDATRAANNRATINELQALFGWTDVKMPMLYTKAADRQHLSMEAMDKIGVREADANETATSIPAPKGEVRAITRKGK